MASCRAPASGLAARLQRAAAPPAAAKLPGLRRWSASSCAGEAGKPWRLSASVVVLAPYHSVPGSGLTDEEARDAHFDYRVCCVRRAAKSSFMPDAMVFPGGAVEAEDVRSAVELLGSDSLDATLRCAAVREAFEESGVGIFEPPLAFGAGAAEAHSAWRRRVREDASELRALCRGCGTAPAAAALHFWCSFITPDMEHARLRRGGFDARFFVWCAGDEAVRWATADQQETVQLLWLTPLEALEAVRRGRITMVPPQWYILKELAEACPRLAGVPAYAASTARALQRGYPIKPYPAALSDEDRAAMLARHGKDSTAKEPVFSLCYPGDEAHPVFPGAPGSRHRMLMIGALGGHVLYELQRDTEPQLPLREAVQGWHTLAKL